MAAITVKLVDSRCVSDFYFTTDYVGHARHLLQHQQYKTTVSLNVAGQGESAAEQVFDLTNNPSRREDRAELYGSHRSVGVGDIVTVDGVDYLCAPVGWEII